METLVLKLVATPVLIGGATLVGRRSGQQVGGWWGCRSPRGRWPCS